MTIKIEDLLNGLETRLSNQPQGITKEDFQAGINELGETIKKAIQPELIRNEGTGSIASAPGDPFEADPVAHLLKKSQKPDELTDQEKDVLWALTKEYLGYGLKGEL